MTSRKSIAIEALRFSSLPAVFRWAARRPNAFFLDRTATTHGLSVIGCEPALTIRWDIHSGLVSNPVVDWLPSDLHPLEALRRVLSLYTLPYPSAKAGLVSFGNIGYLGYELGSLFEPRVPTRPGPTAFPAMYWAFFDRFLVTDFNSADGKGALAIAVDCPLWSTLGLSLKSASSRALELSDLVKSECRGRPESEPLAPSACNLTADFDRADYCRAVARVIEYIRAGDIFQANLSQRFTADQPLPSPELYLRLREVSPAPHAAYLSLGDPDGPAVLSASPELFLHLSDDGLITTKPIKGTRPRGKTPAEDERLKAELRDSIKDQAELTMIVDLERNDLGRVCEYGSVKVTQPRVIESFPNVHHGVATVQGKLRADKDRIDLLRATFPGGSITGAPKVRAMQIIHELERSPRQVYTGSIGRFGMNGGMDLNIAIRTLLAADGKVSFGVGGGIVADSDPESEYEETLHKAAGLIRALEG